ncbi:MAG: hypothetical protein WAM14_10660 [Candidatus Nitrosopolaris sp.]
MAWFSDNAESLDPEWKTYSRGRGQHFSHSNVDAKGAAISPEQMGKVQRMRRWNKISSNNRSYKR